MRRDSKVNTTTAKTGFIPKWRHHRYRPIFMLRRPILPPSEPDILKSCTFRSSQVHAHSRDSVCRLRVSCVSPLDFAGVNSVVAGFKPEGFRLYWKNQDQKLGIFCVFWQCFAPAELHAAITLANHSVGCSPGSDIGFCLFGSIWKLLYNCWSDCITLVLKVLGSLEGWWVNFLRYHYDEWEKCAISR